MMPVAPSFKVHNLVLAILIVSSTFHFLIYRVSGVINIQLFDLLLLIYFIIILRDMLVIHVDGWIKLFSLLIFFQFVHNIFFSSDILFVIKELVQGIELLIFYFILRKFFSNQNNVSYGQKEKKHSKINMNLSKIVTYCVTFHFLESVNMSSSRGVSKLLCVLITYLCSHIPIYKIYNGVLSIYTQSETQP